MEIKYLCEEWFEKNKFDCNASSVRDAMLSMDSKLKEVEACCLEAGLGSIGYQDKTDLIEEWYDIQNRLVKAVDGIGSYIIDDIDKPFAENIAYIYDKAKSMSLENYTTKNIFHNSKTSGVEGLSTFHEKEKITLHDLMGMAQLETVQTDDNFLNKATEIYHQQYNSYRENNKNVKFDDFIAQTFGIQNDKMTSVNKNELLGMIGGFANHWEPHNLIQALSKIYEEEKEKNGLFLTAAILRAANTRKVPTSGKIKTTTVMVTSPKLKGSQMAECAVYVLKQRNSINGILSKAAKKAMEALVKARKNLEGTGQTVTSLEQAYIVITDYVNGGMVSDDLLNNAISFAAVNGTQTQIKSLASLNDIEHNYDRYDNQILGWTNYWNNALKDTENYITIDSNVVKALIYTETKMGYYSGSVSANGSVDIMQVLDGRNPAIQRLAACGEYDPNEGYYYGLPKNGYGILKNMFPNGTYDNSASTVNMSIAFGIRWFEYKVALTGNFDEGINAYNGGGDSDYVEDVNDILKKMK